jgi:hypothetical protein
MYCIFCYKNPITTTNLRTQVKKKINFLLQNKWNNHSSKTCGCRSYCFAKRIEEEVNSLLKEIEEKKLVIFF